MPSRGSGIGASYQGYMSLGNGPSGRSPASGTGTGLTGQTMYGSKSKGKGGWSTDEPTVYLVALVILEAAVLLGLRVGFKAHHGG